MMNEKIKALAEQAELLQERDGEVYLLEHATEDLQKFAELIIANIDLLKPRTAAFDPYNLDWQKYIKMCNTNGMRGRIQEADFQDYVDINGNPIPYISKKKKKKDEE